MNIHSLNVRVVCTRTDSLTLINSGILRVENRNPNLLQKLLQTLRSQATIMYVYKHVKDDQRQRLAVVPEDGSVGIRTMDEEHKHLVHGKPEYTLVENLDESSRARLFCWRRERGEMVHYLFRTPVAQWTGGACSWNAEPPNSAGEVLLAPTGSIETPYSDIQYHTVSSWIGDLYAVAKARLDVWEFAGQLVKTVSPQARALDQWVSSRLLATENMALIYMVQSVLFTLYDGEHRAEDADDLACKLWEYIGKHVDPEKETSAALFVKHLELEELDTLETCLDDWLFDGEDERADSDERYQAAKTVITDAKALC